MQDLIFGFIIAVFQDLKVFPAIWGANEKDSWNWKLAVLFGHCVLRELDLPPPNLWFLAVYFFAKEYSSPQD